MTDPMNTWRAVLEHPTLLDAAVAVDAGDVAAVGRLRRLAGVDAAMVGVALDLAAARQKLAAKHGDAAAQWVATVEAAEQASGGAVAAHKAQRIVERLGVDAAVLDLCCGIGGDLQALAAAGLDVTGVDADPLRAWMAAQNTGRPTLAADVLDAPLDRCAAFHLDPGRRVANVRVSALHDYLPPPDAWRELLGRQPNACIKLAPGVDREALLELGLTGELECISDHGRLVQGVLWTGQLAGDAPVRATLLRADATHTLAGVPGLAPLGDRKRFIHTVDPSVERVGLLNVLVDRLIADGSPGVALLHPAWGLLTSDAPIDSPWLTSFEMLDERAWRIDKVKRWLRDHDAGDVAVKTRGKAVNPDDAARRLSGPGGTPYVVHVLRDGHQVRALVTRRAALG